MANKRIIDLTLRSDFDASCNLAAHDNVQTWRTTGAQVAAFIRNLPFWQGYHDLTGSVVWNTTSGTFADFTVQSGTANLETLISDGLSVSTAASDLPGITFTPVSGGLYRIKAKCIYQGTLSAGNGASALRLWDGSASISDSQAYYTNASGGRLQEMVLEGFWLAPSASPVTFKIQGQVGGDTSPLLGLGYTTNVIEWIVEQKR